MTQPNPTYDEELDKILHQQYWSGYADGEDNYSGANMSSDRVGSINDNKTAIKAATLRHIIGEDAKVTNYDITKSPHPYLDEKNK